MAAGARDGRTNEVTHGPPEATLNVKRRFDPENVFRAIALPEPSTPLPTGTDR
ncbi:hypothetical protein [Promicromonospora sp. MEB111]|uniref:hypothetical protein n=1 Tax=Promicromonospora sp. MEB111 TaxID=3040301 RepID=UPI0025500978|nr:hypothetical protein [Promicromonospora sp. MEB111]